MSTASDGDMILRVQTEDERRSYWAAQGFAVQFEYCEWCGYCFERPRLPDRDPRPFRVGHIAESEHTIAYADEAPT